MSPDSSVIVFFLTWSGNMFSALEPCPWESYSQIHESLQSVYQIEHSQNITNNYVRNYILSCWAMIYWNFSITKCSPFNYARVAQRRLIRRSFFVQPDCNWFCIYSLRALIVPTEYKTLANCLLLKLITKLCKLKLRHCWVIHFNIYLPSSYWFI